jgi:hypothetical protein
MMYIIVKPNFIEGHVKQTGTVVEGYRRDGGGNTSISRGVEKGGGYTANNPIHYGG